MMSPVNRAKVEAAKRAGRRMVGGVYKRTRLDENGEKVQRAEVRFDDVAGCLRTPAGGSSRQVIMVVDGAKVRTRLISSRETARLMGLQDDYQLPEELQRGLSPHRRRRGRPRRAAPCRAHLRAADQVQRAREGRRMTVIPCERDAIVRAQIERFVEMLKTEAHILGNHGFSEKDFYKLPILRGAIEVMRGEYSAKLGPKREFVQHVLNHLEDGGHIAGWERDEGRARHDYTVRLNSGRIAVIDLKGCLDGNNTTISERPAGADEFVVWSVCTNVGADPELNAWSGVHSRLGAEMIARGQRVRRGDHLGLGVRVRRATLPKTRQRPDRPAHVGGSLFTAAALYLRLSRPDPEPGGTDRGGANAGRG